MYKLHLSFTYEQLNEIITKDSSEPPYAYQLPEGLSITDIRYPSRVGPWGLEWVGTKGSNDRGWLILRPMNSFTRVLMKEYLFRYYKANGFDHNEAKSLSVVKVRDFHNKEVLDQIKQISSFSVYEAFKPYIYKDNVLTLMELETLRNDLADCFTGCTNNERLRGIVQTFRNLLCPKQQ